MATPTEEKALLLAIELLRKQIADLPMSLVMNAGKSVEDLAAEAHALAKSQYDSLGFGRDEGFSRKEPQAAGDVAGSNPFFARQMDRLGKGLGVVTNGAGVLGSALGRLLGPLGSVTTYLMSSASGAQVFSAAMGLFASSVGPIVMPLFFTLAVGLTAASDVLFKRLMPAMDAFTKWVLGTGIPAMEAFASVVGKAADALKWIADSKVGKLAVGGDTGGGMLGSFDRLTGSDSGPESDGSSVGMMKSAHRGMDDVARSVGGRAGGQLADAKNYLMREVGHGIFGGNKEDYEVDKGMGVKGGGGGASEKRGPEVGRGFADVLKELQLTFGSKASVGDLRGNYRNTQMSALNMSPFQQRTLQMMSQMLAQLQKGASATSGSPDGAYTDPRDLLNTVELVKIMAAGGR